MLNGYDKEFIHIVHCINTYLFNLNHIPLPP